MATRSSITSWRMSATVSATVLVAHQLDALLEDDLALVVHHVVEFQQVLADVEVARLDLLLRLLQRLVDPGMDDRLVLLEAELLQHAVQRPSRRCASDRLPATGRTWSGRDRPGGRSGRAAGCRCAGSRGARCRARRGRRRASAFSFSRATSARISAARGSRRARAALRHVGELLADAHVGIAAELDVGAAAGHVGGDRDGARHAGLREI